MDYYDEGVEKEDEQIEKSNFVNYFSEGRVRSL